MALSRITNYIEADGADLNLQSSDTTITASSVLGVINFKAPSEASGTDAILLASKIEAVAEGTFSASSNATKLSFATASSEAAAEKMALSSGGDLSIVTDGASIFFGADSEIELRHVADDGLILKHVGTGDGKEPSLTFQAGDNDIAQDDVLGSIFFQAPDEGAGTDAVLVAAGIEAVSEGDFSSSSNATKLGFKTGASEAATTKMELTSGGDMKLLTDTGSIFFGADSDIELRHVADEGLTIKAVDTGGNSGLGPVLNLSTGDTDIAAGNQLGTINFQAPDEGTGTDAILVGASITAIAQDAFSSSVNSTSLLMRTSTSGTNDGGYLELTPTGNVNIRNQNSADDSFPTLTLQTGDTDIAQNDVLGKISFQAPSEGAGTDAVLAGASIRAISEGDFSASNNATTLEFMTGASEAPTRRMRISSTGETTITRAGSVTDHGGLLRLNGTYSSTNNGPNIMFHGTATSQYPTMQILNYSSADQSINFDSYYNSSGSWISSNANSNAQIVNRSNTLRIGRANGVSAGSAITWTTAHTFNNTSGQVITEAVINSVSHYIRNNHGSSPYGAYIQFENAAPDNNDNYFLRCVDSSATRATIFSDGDVNTSDAGTLTSDSKNKNTITDASSKYDDVKKLQVRNFYWNEDYHPNKKDKKMIGFIAQEFETVFPGLVTEMKDTVQDEKEDTNAPIFYNDNDTIPDGKKIGDIKGYEKAPYEKDLGTTTKVIREGKLIPILTKALQECMVKIETLESEVKTLKDKSSIILEDA